jgi:hypothetical protein
MGLVKSHKSTAKIWLVQKRKGFRTISNAQAIEHKRNYDRSSNTIFYFPNQ